MGLSSTSPPMAVCTMLKHMVHTVLDMWWRWWNWWFCWIPSAMENFSKLKLLSLVQQSGGCAGHQSGTRPRSILALLGVWVLHLKFAFRHVFLRLPIPHMIKGSCWWQAYLEDPEDHKGLKDHSDRISVGVTKRARRRGGKPRWLSHSTSCTYSPWKVKQVICELGKCASCSIE